MLNIFGDGTGGTSGPGIQSSPMNENFNRMFDNIIIQKIEMLEDRAITQSKGLNAVFAEAYVDGDGRQNSVDTSSSTGVTFNTDSYEVDGDVPYFIIEASSISAIGDFAINNCKISVFSTGKWLLQCTTGTNAVKRAQIYKTLFYGTNGTDPRASSTYITGITALKTNISRDVGKRGIYAIATNANNTGTFSNTTTNTSCSAWSWCDITAVGANEIGTDTEADEEDNPANVAMLKATNRAQFQFPAGSLVNGGDATDPSTAVRAIILCAGTISWTNSPTVTDFTADNSIPELTTLTETIPSEIHHNIPTSTFTNTASSAIAAVKIKDWEDGASLQYKLTNATEDTGWLDFNIDGDEAYGKISSFTAFTAEPTKFIVRLIPKSSSPTAGYPSIYGAGVMVN